MTEIELFKPVLRKKRRYNRIKLKEIAEEIVQTIPELRDDLNPTASYVVVISNRNYDDQQLALRSEKYLAGYGLRIYKYSNSSRYNGEFDILEERQELVKRLKQW